MHKLMFGIGCPCPPSAAGPSPSILLAKTCFPSFLSKPNNMPLSTALLRFPHSLHHSAHHSFSTCSLHTAAAATPFRAWILHQQLHFSTYTPSFCSQAEAAVTDTGGVENVKSRVQRRQRSGGTTVVGSPDLLTIPGVGPRNLRKLVEKGFHGVAQLKQLYKDKVYK